MDVLDARMLVESILREMAPDQPLAIDDESTIETADWWIFFYDTQPFLESGRDEDRLTGATPIVVDRRTGDAHLTPSWKDLKQFLSELSSGGSNDG